LPNEYYRYQIRCFPDKKDNKTMNKLKASINELKPLVQRAKSLVFSPGAAPVAVMFLGILLHASFSVAATSQRVVLGGPVIQDQVVGSLSSDSAIATNPILSDLGEIGSEAGQVGAFSDSVAAQSPFGGFEIAKKAATTISTPGERSVGPSHCGLTSFLPNGFMWPAVGPIGEPHGHLDPFTGVPIGRDIPNKLGTTIVASGDGIVERATYGWEGGYGNVIIINHGNGLKTLYSHLNDILVVAGEHKKKGEAIGFMGSTGHSTGPHVHFEVRCNY
jgi:hypothetical protein